MDPLTGAPAPPRSRLRRLAPIAAAVAAMVLCVPFLTADAPVPPALAVTRTATPVMGFNGWNAFGCDVTARLVEDTADAMVATGMAAAGYRYVNLDDCWMAPARDASGNLVADPVKFPDGIAAVAAYVHARGLSFGIYADAGTTTCAGYPGSLGHETADAATFAAWGVDYVKYDQCHIPWEDYPGLDHAQVDRHLYAAFARALAGTGRPIVLSACTGVDETSQPTQWAPAVAGLWRTTPDIDATFATLVANTRLNATYASDAGPGAWNDPDMLEIGNSGLTPTEQRAQLTLWAVMAAPLLAGTDLSAADPTTIAIYTNPAVVAVDQDPLGVQGRLVLDQDGLLAFSKPLADGRRAVVLFNTTGATTPMSVTREQAGIETSGPLTLVDAWGGRRTTSDAGIAADVEAHAAVMYLVSSA